jgi:hypothetical protein
MELIVAALIVALVVNSAVGSPAAVKDRYTQGDQRSLLKGLFTQSDSWRVSYDTTHKK